MEPTASSIDFLTVKFCQDQKEKTSQVHRQRAPANPVVVNQAREHEREKADHHPVCLLAPKFRRHRIFTHISRAVDGDDAKNGERKHVGEKKPIECKELAQKWSHFCLEPI